jgi:hypothetical protein
MERTFMPHEKNELSLRNIEGIWFSMINSRAKAIILNILDSITDVLDSPKFTIFWMSLLLLAGILAIFLNMFAT